MPACPECKTMVRSPVKVWATSDPSRDGGLVERHVGLYECTKCKTKFPYVYGSQSLKLVKVIDWQKLQEEYTKAKEQVVLLGKEQADLRAKLEQMELDLLSSKAQGIRDYISLLKEWRLQVQYDILPLEEKLAVTQKA